MRFLKDNGGAATVEFAIVATLFVTLLFGIIEFGFVMSDYLALSDAARDGARLAALGNTTSTITTDIQRAALMLTSSSITVNLYKRKPGNSSGAWQSLGDISDGTQNDANPGDQIRVSLIYPHKLMTGGLFSWLAPGGSTLNIESDMVMSRE